MRAALTNLGMALAQLHKAVDGIPFLKRAVTIVIRRPHGSSRSGSGLHPGQSDRRRVAELKTAIKLSPDSPQLHYDLGTAYKLQDDATDAIPELERPQN